MNYTFFGPDIDADAYLNESGCLEKVVIHHPVHPGRYIEIPGDWYDGVPCDNAAIISAVSQSLNGAKVHIK
ncbi:MAG: hypothetical protein LKE81_11470 [Acetobacter sp.]|jgi:hypothetical protein|nr:hypothetical protein [Acetobacter sp.]MCH4062003.1 hypothetical protein [Acetobacter sp.]MCH4089148.1 hypothetical protein [Acetobacter sp.]